MGEYKGHGRWQPTHKPIHPQVVFASKILYLQSLSFYTTLSSTFCHASHHSVHFPCRQRGCALSCLCCSSPYCWLGGNQALLCHVSMQRCGTALNRQRHLTVDDASRYSDRGTFNIPD